MDEGTAGRKADDIVRMTLKTENTFKTSRKYDRRKFRSQTSDNMDR